MKRSGRLVAALLGLMVLTASAHDGGADALDFAKAPAGVLPWGALAKVGVRYVDDRPVPTFLPPVLALDGTRVTLYGYMTPVDPGRQQRRFLLSWRPIFCAGCERPIGPEGIVEIDVDRPVAATKEPIAVRGTLHVLRNDPMNVFYRLTGAGVVAPSRGRGRTGPAPAIAAPATRPAPDH